ncbi:hypothetical protein DRP53_08515 [candidate division WOR-3 bacterium]|uniref:Uncharacterized protein n=1 Tax=candidate division WOR-3 bacterium TaxID=2052148 RepID=A0A660SEW3_UNCW3|nr:MAG: hypothetical protein DRP53_08515 [candidate division WOR-3 bacterium]
MRINTLPFILGLIIGLFIASLLNAQRPKPESMRYQIIQGRYDRSQLFILDTYTGCFWYVDYWGIPEEKPRVKGPYPLSD